MQEIVSTLIILGTVIVIGFRILDIRQAFIGATILFIVSGILAIEDFLISFANYGVVLLTELLAISAVISRSAMFYLIFKKGLRLIKKIKIFHIVLYGIVSFTSAFVNNTPLMILLKPYFLDLARTTLRNPGIFVYPLMICITCGGMLTLIGSSTNQIANSILFAIKKIELSVVDFLFSGIWALPGALIFLYIAAYLGFLEDKSFNNSVDFENVNRDVVISRYTAGFLFWGVVISVFLFVFFNVEITHLFGILLGIIFVFNFTPQGFFRKHMDWDTVLIAGTSIFLAQGFQKTIFIKYVPAIGEFIYGIPSFWKFFIIFCFSSIIASILSARGAITILIPLIINFQFNSINTDLLRYLTLAVIYGASCGFMLPTGHPVFYMAFKDSRFTIKRFFLLGTIGVVVIGFCISIGLWMNCKC